jgi:hypothetical protein
LSTTVAISHVLLALVLSCAFGVAPWLTGWSSTASSMSLAGDTFTRPLQPLPELSVSPNPESTPRSWRCTRARR